MHVKAFRPKIPSQNPIAERHNRPSGKGRMIFFKKGEASNPILHHLWQILPASKSAIDDVMCLKSTIPNAC